MDQPERRLNQVRDPHGEFGDLEALKAHVERYAQSAKSTGGMTE